MKRDSIINGQFRKVSSAGGVGRKFEERAAYSLRFHGRYAEAGIDHQRSVQGSFFRRGVGRKFQERAAHQLKIPWEISRGGNRSSEVSSGKFLPPGASEESARKVPKAGTHIVL